MLAFDNLKSVKLPAKCYCVGISAFENCTNLAEITFSPALQLIYDRAFAGSQALKRVLLPATVEKVDSTAFINCPNVEELAIPQAIRYNVFEIFRHSTNLKKLYILSLSHYKFPKNNPIKGFPNKECKVYVQDSQLDEYKKDPTWSKFGEILPLSQSGIYDGMGMLIQ